MRLTVLGSGTCAPSGTRASAGLWVDAGAARVGLDCGSGSVHAMARFNLPWQTLSHQFISHFHIDHVGELPALLFGFKYGRTGTRAQPLTLVGPVGLRALVDRLCEVFRERLLEQEFPVELVELVPGGGDPLTPGRGDPLAPGVSDPIATRMVDTLALAPGANLRVCKTPHTVESLAARIEADGRALGYTGDTAPSPELARFFADVDLLVAECSFLEPTRRTRHLSADEVADLATAAGARHLVATHCYFDPEAARLGERLAARFGGRITIASDGLTVDA